MKAYAATVCPCWMVLVILVWCLDAGWAIQHQAPENKSPGFCRIIISAIVAALYKFSPSQKFVSPETTKITLSKNLIQEVIESPPESVFIWQRHLHRARAERSDEQRIWYKTYLIQKNMQLLDSISFGFRTSQVFPWDLKKEEAMNVDRGVVALQSSSRIQGVHATTVPENG